MSICKPSEVCGLALVALIILHPYSAKSFPLLLVIEVFHVFQNLYIRLCMFEVPLYEQRTVKEVWREALTGASNSPHSSGFFLFPQFHFFHDYD